MRTAVKLKADPMGPTPERLTMTQLFDSVMHELAEGHLALDRLGAPREIHESDIIRECLIAERIQSIFSAEKDNEL